ncbi:TPA: hypothetical protein ACX5G1_000735 [Neisseria meningitidis]|uniref:hypothetical protein n=1 Tax=Neisseria polysaccharea TaxID=489 RepID=UPI00260BD980
MPSEVGGGGGGGGIGGGGGLKPTLQSALHTAPQKKSKKPNLTKSDKKRQPETDKNCHN